MKAGEEIPPVQSFVAHVAGLLLNLPSEGNCLLVIPEVARALAELEISLPQPEMVTFPQACRKFCSTARRAGLFVTEQIWIHGQQTRTVWNSESDYRSWLKRVDEAKRTGLMGAKKHVDSHTIEPGRYK